MRDQSVVQPPLQSATEHPGDCKLYEDKKLIVCAIIICKHNVLPSTIGDPTALASVHRNVHRTSTKRKRFLMCMARLLARLDEGVVAVERQTEASGR